LKLQEELLLLSLNEKGKIANPRLDFALAAAVIAELLLEGWVNVHDSRGHRLVAGPDIVAEDPLLDEYLSLIQNSRRARRLSTWIGRFSETPLKSRVTESLIERDILDQVRRNRLGVFKTTRYVELDPSLRKDLRGRIWAAVFTDHGGIDDRTILLTSIAHNSEMLNSLFGAKTVRTRKPRIKNLLEGEVVGAALQEAIDEADAIALVAG
jgi:hypothetical protein